MAAIFEPEIERRRFRLKNKKLERTPKEIVRSIGGPTTEDERITDLLSFSFALPICFALSPHELANLEASCRCCNFMLSGDNAALIWTSSVYAALRGRRILLPIPAFFGAPLRQVKHIFSSMKCARGFMNESAFQLSDGIEFKLVSSICKQAVAYEATAANTSARVVVGRLHFCQQGLLAVHEEEAEDTDEDLDLDDGMYTSDAITFCWPRQGLEKKATMLEASLVLLNGVGVIELSSVIQPLQPSPCALSVDVHLGSPLWPKIVKAEGIKVHVNSCCSGFDFRDIDLTEERTREALNSPDGLFCTLVVRDLARDVSNLPTQKMQAKTNLTKDGPNGLAGSSQLF